LEEEVLLVPLVVVLNVVEMEEIQLLEELLPQAVEVVEAYSLVHLFQMVVEEDHLVVQVVDPEVVD
jgi:hypothetical protein